MPLFGRRNDELARENNRDATCPYCRAGLYRLPPGQLGETFCDCGRMSLRVVPGRTPGVPDIEVRADGRVVATFEDDRITSAQWRERKRQADRDRRDEARRNAGIAEFLRRQQQK